MRWVVVHRNESRQVIHLTTLEVPGLMVSAETIVEGFRATHPNASTVMGVMPEEVFDTLPEGVFLGIFA
jgi:hypothetical protein